MADWVTRGLRKPGEKETLCTSPGLEGETIIDNDHRI